MGLWRSCQSVPGFKECVSIPCPSPDAPSGSCGKIMTARAFVTLVCITSAISALFLFLFGRMIDSENRLVLLIIKCLVVASLVMGIIGVAVGINGTTTFGGIAALKVGAGGAMGIVAIILNFFGLIATLLIT
ncbi:hypothetical protein I4U23_016272 [Adineta vaga]|nr:hypothetical protein I4U23_016272 [Adineta vaga]